MNKRAQFFLLAAVIISAVVISLGITANQAKINREPGNFYDFSYDMKREIGMVLDYEIYSDFEDNANLTTFVKLLSDNIRDKNPEANFLVLFGNSDSMELRNYGSEDAFIGDNSVSGADVGVISQICYESFCGSVSDVISDFNEGAGSVSLQDVGDNVKVTIMGNEFSFNISKHRQVIFIMHKGVGDESFVAVN